MMTPDGARHILAFLDAEQGQDFHTLSNATVEQLLSDADLVKYRKPKNANGSRARYFYAFLQRVAAREE